MNGLFLFCYHFYGFSPFLELRYLFYSRSSHVSVVPILRSYFPIYEWFVPIFVIILMGYHLFLRYFFFSASSLVSFVPIFISFFPRFFRSFVHILLIQKFTCDPTERFIYYCKSVLHLLKWTWNMCIRNKTSKNRNKTYMWISGIEQIPQTH